MRGQPGDELRSPDRGGGLAFAGARPSEEQRGEILHAIPQRRFVGAHVVGEDAVPERFAQATHRLGVAGERALDEVERASQLVEEGEVSRGACVVEAGADESRDHFVGERHRQRRAALRLSFDQRVDVADVAVIRDVLERGSYEEAVVHAQAP